MGLRMNRGKYKGKLITELPSDYLYWVAENWDDDNIATESDEEHIRRTDESKHWFEEK